VTDETHDVETEQTEETAEATEDDDSDTEALAEAGSSRGRTERARREWPRPLREVKVVPALLVLLLVLSGGVAAWLYFEQYRPKQQTNPSVERAVVKAASDGTVALLSYSPESLDKDFANAKTHLSGDFLSYYNQFTEQIVAPAAKEKSLKTTAQVIGAAVSELHPKSAVVLVFIDQSTTSRDRPDPALAASSVLVSLTWVNDTWLITKFDPV
jgi:Mce-associated membrane protein